LGKYERGHFTETFALSEPRIAVFINFQECSINSTMFASNRSVFGPNMYETYIYYNAVTNL